VFQTQTEVRSNQTHNITGLNPDTNYTVSFAVINNAGQGHAAYFSKLTLEEGKSFESVSQNQISAPYFEHKHGVGSNFVIAQYVS